MISILKGKGCTGGPDKPSAGNSDIFSCPGVGKLSFRFGTTTGNQLRALAFEIMQRQLKSVGIELVPRFQTGGVLFGTTLPSSDWDLLMFTYGQSPSSKITANGLYACPNQQGRPELRPVVQREGHGAPEQRSRGSSTRPSGSRC